MRDRLTDAARADLLRLHGLGWSDRRIARALFVARRTVGNWRRRLGLPPNGWGDDNRRAWGERKRRWWLRRRPAAAGPAPEGKVGAHASINLLTHSAAETELLAAVTAFRSRHRRVPTLVEGFRLALGLGWRKGGGDD